MKFTQVVAVGAALVAQAQACTRIHVEAWNENGQEYKNIELYDNNNPVLYMARDTSVKDTSYYYYTVPGNKKYGVRLMKDSTNPDKIAGAVEFSPTNFGEIFTQGYSKLDLEQKTDVGARNAQGHMVYCLWDNYECGGYTCGA